MCKHPRTRKEFLDIGIASLHGILVMDVPCEVCEQCGEIVKQEPILAEAIQAASLKADGTCEEFRLVPYLHSRTGLSHRTARGGLRFKHSPIELKQIELPVTSSPDLQDRSLENDRIPFGNRCPMDVHEHAPMLHVITRALVRDDPSKDRPVVLFIDKLQCPTCGILVKSTERGHDIRDVLEKQLVRFKNPSLDVKACKYCNGTFFIEAVTRLPNDGQIEHTNDVQLKAEYENEAAQHRGSYAYCDQCLHVHWYIRAPKQNPNFAEEHTAHVMALIGRIRILAFNER